MCESNDRRNRLSYLKGLNYDSSCSIVILNIDFFESLWNTKLTVFEVFFFYRLSERLNVLGELSVAFEYYIR